MSNTAQWVKLTGNARGEVIIVNTGKIFAIEQDGSVSLIYLKFKTYYLKIFGITLIDTLVKTQICVTETPDQILALIKGESIHTGKEMD